MLCLVVNLAAAPDRLAHMARAFARLGLPFERVDGLLGSDLVARSGPHPRLGPGTYGCLASHLAACRRIAESGEPWGAIFEDDLHFSADAARFLRDADWIPAGVDLVKLETFSTVTCLARVAAATVDGHDLKRLLAKHLGGGAYIVSARLAVRLAALDPRGIDVPIDTLLFNPRHLIDPNMVTLQMVPAIAIQEFKLFTPAEVRLASAIEPDRRERRAERYSGLLGRLRGATKSSRDALKRKIREIRQTIELRREDWERTTVPFGPPAD
ncbi:glycosyltransferase family 25 protein [Siculibacillus lacustris]|uniref:Glycosyltransferase family 25 protein n=1 Tax=Siculibacillus lacustris TaxID=1549641 RepID=A0A4Q9VPJ5_9HYPH|nr:glycosyltransferase family 25 protein [Siculibacillus lacustris]TBW37658.1 glycosyltransferase family 25 protein [Siculibacillus lacustris]